MDDWDDGSKEDSIRYVSVLGVCCQKAQAGHGLLISGRFFSLPVGVV